MPASWAAWRTRRCSRYWCKSRSAGDQRAGWAASTPPVLAAGRRHRFSLRLRAAGHPRRARGVLRHHRGGRGPDSTPSRDAAGTATTICDRREVARHVVQQRRLRLLPGQAGGASTTASTPCSWSTCQSGVTVVRTPEYAHTISHHHPIVAFDNVACRPATGRAEGDGMGFAYEWFGSSGSWWRPLPGRGRPLTQR